MVIFNLVRRCSSPAARLRGWCQLCSAGLALLSGERSFIGADAVRQIRCL